MKASLFCTLRLITLVLGTVALGPALAQTAPAMAAGNCPALLQHTADRLQDEKPQSLCQYAGKVLLVVNTASFCGFTPQYTGLEALHARYKDQGLVVLGFPSNDFAQERGSTRTLLIFVKTPSVSNSLCSPKPR